MWQLKKCYKSLSTKWHLQAMRLLRVFRWSKSIFSLSFITAVRILMAWRCNVEVMKLCGPPTRFSLCLSPHLSPFQRPLHSRKCKLFVFQWISSYRSSEPWLMSLDSRIHLIPLAGSWDMSELIMPVVVTNMCSRCSLYCKTSPREKTHIFLNGDATVYQPKIQINHCLVQKSFIKNQKGANVHQTKFT